MIGLARRGLVIFSTACLTCLCGYAAMAGGDPQPSVMGRAQTFTLQTPVSQIAADPRGKAVLERDLPGLLSNPNYSSFASMNLSQLAALSGGRLSKAKLVQVNADLAALSSGK